jgi:anionic cell wall polymer biosynthesis LytR-Cps2A-Psr (LCP) family protein
LKRKLIISGLVFLIMLVVLSSYYIYSINTRNIIEKLSINKKLINILIAGSNVYNKDRHRFYAILSINPDNSKVGLTFIPPSLRISYGSKKNVYHKIGELEISDFKRMSEFFNRELKLQVPFYVEMYSSDLKRVIDLIEGIDIYIIDQVKDIHNLKYGLNYLDGEKVVKYINSADENSIFSKYDRIQDILLTFYYNKDTYRRFKDIQFIEEALRTIKTNLLPQEILSLGDLLLKDSDMYCMILPGKFSENGYYVTDNIAYKIYENAFLKQLALDEDIDTVIKIKILNGTNVPGLARKMRNMLIRDGLNVVEFGTSPYPLLDRTVIINQKGNIEKVRRVSELIGTDRIFHVIDSTQLHCVLIIIGEDFAK